MEWNQIDWEQHKEMIKSRWDKLTPEDIDDIGGVRETLAEKIHERYGVDNAKVEEEISVFVHSLQPPLEPGN